MYNAFKRLSRAYSPAERAALFHDTAVRVYRIDVEPPRGRSRKGPTSFLMTILRIRAVLFG